MKSLAISEYRRLFITPSPLVLSLLKPAQPARRSIFHLALLSYSLSLLTPWNKSPHSSPPPLLSSPIMPSRRLAPSFPFPGSYRGGKNQPDSSTNCLFIELEDSSFFSQLLSSLLNLKCFLLPINNPKQVTLGFSYPCKGAHAIKIYPSTSYLSLRHGAL